MSYTAHIRAYERYQEALITRGRLALYFFVYDL